ncbi:MAG: tRNA epoxyqueuosine(34) reductase QueG [Chthoniobacterales bacterium]
MILSDVTTSTVTPTDSNDFVKTRVQELSRELGFNLCRIGSCAAPAHAGEFREWLAAGEAGEMHYMERGEEKRCDPQQVLPGARSLIILAMNYWQGAHDSRPDGAAKGRIARYAWGDDYHDVIAPKLESIDGFLRECGGTQKCYVDTGPVLERDHAASAGVGWQGKSSMLINTDLGTWFFLAEILTTLELPADAPARERCGTCTRCITACPTGAITKPHHVDARKCISYLTIEHKTSIPTDLRPLIGDRIFGCDDCLDACPWNRFAEASRESAFQAQSSTVNVPLRDYLSLTDEEFRQMFRKSPIKRIKRRGFLRNVCVALGNVGEIGDLPALELAAKDPEPLIAEHAQWATDEIKRRAQRLSRSTQTNSAESTEPPGRILMKSS